MNNAPQPQEGNRSPETLETLKARKTELLEEATKLRVDIARLGDIKDGGEDYIAQAAGKLRAYRTLLIETEEKLTKIDAEILALQNTVKSKSTENVWNETGATGGDVKKDVGQSQEGRGFRS